MRTHPSTNLTIAIDGFRAVMERYRYTSGATYVHQLVRAFASDPRVDRILLLTPDDTGTPESDVLANETKLTILSADVPYSPADGFWRQVKWIQVGLPRMLKQRASEIDVFIAPYHHTPAVTPRRIRIAAVVHDLCGLGYGYPRTKYAFYRHLAMLASASLFADKVIPISEFTRREFLRRFRWARGRVTRPVYNGIDDAIVDDELTDLSLAEVGLRRKQYFYAMAAAHPRKGTDILLESFVSYREAGGTQAIVVLGGQANKDQILTSLPTALHEEVVLLPRIPDALRNSLYRGATAFVFPSRCEGFGYPILEAMRQGCPVIAHEESPAREIIGTTMPLLEQLDPTEIALFMRRWETMSESGGERTSSDIIARSHQFGPSFGESFLDALLA